jgi:ribosomal protein S18 acetylase RimI-like enzyme
LLEAGERAARERGCERIGLEVRRDNPVAQALYERRGYQRAGESPDYYEDGEIALRYEKRLSSSSAFSEGVRRVRSRPD